MSQSTLFLGYSQVHAFKDADEYLRDDDGEVEEEVSYVTLDLGSVQPTLLSTSKTYRLAGLDTPTPFLQLSGTIFKGEHHNLLGTELLFSEDKDETDPAKKCALHLANTEKRIRFKEVELRPKDQPKSDTLQQSEQKLADISRKDDTVVQRGGRGRGRGRGRGNARGKGKGRADPDVPTTDYLGREVTTPVESSTEEQMQNTQDAGMDLT